MKHTSKPWYKVGFVEYPAKKRGHLIRAEHGKEIARLPITSETEDEQRANSALISASPDLLEACRAANLALKSYQYGNNAPDLAKEVSEALERAIAKAEGRAP